MQAFTRVLFAVATLCAALALVGTLGPCAALDPASRLPEFLEECERTDRLLAERQALLAVVEDRARARDRVVGTLLAGRISLWTAAAQFRHLAADWPPQQWGLFREYYGGDSDAERFCRQVLVVARARAEYDPRLDVSVPVAALEAELEQALRHGGIRLPPDGFAEPFDVGTVSANRVGPWTLTVEKGPGTRPGP